MTRFIPAYDVEGSGAVTDGTRIPSCLEACRTIVEIHRRHRMPATFFIVGSVLEEKSKEYRALLDDPLFEVASHSWSHKLLRDHDLCGKAAPVSEHRDEIFRSKELIERVFGRPCRGFRTPVGFPDGLSSAPQLLKLLSDAGHEYVSSQLWGPDFSLPAPLAQSYTYDRQGFPRLREFPGHGWHENLLKPSNKICGQKPRRVVLFPTPFPGAIPPDNVTSPEEEFRYNNGYFIDRGLRDGVAYVSLIQHPWSLALNDPAMRILEMTFTYLRERNVAGATFGEMCGSHLDAPNAKAYFRNH